CPRSNPSRRRSRTVMAERRDLVRHGNGADLSGREAFQKHDHLVKDRKNMRKKLFIAIIITAIFCSRATHAQDSATHVLSLDEAIHLAIANNRSLKIATLDVDKSKWQVAEAKTKRLPAFNTTILGSELLNELSFTFEKGAFGSFPSTGPIPNKDTKVT